MLNKRLLYIKHMSRRIRHKLLVDILGLKYKEVSRICGQTMLDWEESNRIIAKYIRDGAPFCLLRPGNGEYSLANQWDEHLLFGTRRYRNQTVYRNMCDNSDEYAKKWVEIFEEDLKEADIYACFGQDAYMEHYLMEAYAKPRYIIHAGYINALWLDDPWWRELKGKKVLIINPFVETMEMQYKRRELVWGVKEVLPEMDIRFLKSVWYISSDDNSGFSNWFEALEYLYAEAAKIDFDIALISCGPFSTFLAAKFKRDGKQAIQCGGVLQIFFGIRGARWDDSEPYKQFYNEYWVRPPKVEAPKGTDKLDNGISYW